MVAIFIACALTTAQPPGPHAAGAGPPAPRDGPGRTNWLPSAPRHRRAKFPGPFDWGPDLLGPAPRCGPFRPNWRWTRFWTNSLPDSSLVTCFAASSSISGTRVNRGRRRMVVYPGVRRAGQRSAFLVNLEGRAGWVRLKRRAGPPQGSTGTVPNPGNASVVDSTWALGVVSGESRRRSDSKPAAMKETARIRSTVETTGSKRS